MPFNVYVLYPNNEDTEFDLQYYINKHMPLVESRWSKTGLLSWEVIEFSAAAENEEKKAPPTKFRIQTIMVFSTKESFASATGGPDAQEIFGDIPNFTNGQPELMSGQAVGASSSPSSSI